MAKCNLSRPGDVVRVHPLFIVTAHGLGRLGPWNYAYAANLTSALFTAVTVANIFLLVFALTGSTWSGGSKRSWPYSGPADAKGDYHLGGLCAYKS